jgi:hypothetical protein
VNWILTQYASSGADQPFLTIGSVTVDDITSNPETGHIINNKLQA